MELDRLRFARATTMRKLYADENRSDPLRDHEYLASRGQHDLDTVVFLVSERLIGRRRIFQLHAGVITNDGSISPDSTLSKRGFM